MDFEDEVHYGESNQSEIGDGVVELNEEYLRNELYDRQRQ